MSRPVKHLLIRYSVAVLSVAAALAVNLLLRRWEQIPSVVFLAAVLASSWYGGLEAGLTATLLSTLAFDFFFLPDVYSLDFGPATWAWLATYLGAALFINWHHEMQRRLIASLRLQDQRRSELMTVLAHELRNFLSPISLALSAIKSRATGDPVVEQSCAVAERQVQSMTHLINDLLDAARIVQGKVRLHLETVDLGSVIAQAIAGARPQITSRGHLLDVSLPEGSMLLEGDSARLEQIFLNLLTNASKYTDPGGRIWVTADQREDQWVVRVRDNGKGIAPEVLPRIFDLFAQADAGAQDGLGIGLSLVKGLVEIHGGSVAASSAGLGQGSEFVVRLPAAGPSAGYESLSPTSTSSRTSTGRPVRRSSGWDS